MTNDRVIVSRNQGNDAVTIRTKLIDQHGLGRPAKGGSNDVVNRRPIVQLFFERSSRTCTPGSA
jgi:hypothetical protein